jgi:uncharacterized membrane protein
MPTSRLEAFSDGVFAIAATLLILDVTATGPGLSAQLLDIWPEYAAYAVSFISIGIMWINHHVIVDQLGKVDRTFLVLTVIFLMLIAFVPFPTHLIAEYIDKDFADARAAALAYGVTLTSIAIFYNITWRYAAWNGRLLRHNFDERVVSGVSRSYWLGPVSYAVATAVAFVSPAASAALYAAIALFWVLESSIFSRR